MNQTWAKTGIIFIDKLILIGFKKTEKSKKAKYDRKLAYQKNI